MQQVVPSHVLSVVSVLSWAVGLPYAISFQRQSKPLTTTVSSLSAIRVTTRWLNNQLVLQCEQISYESKTHYTYSYHLFIQALHILVRITSK